MSEDNPYLTSCPVEHLVQNVQVRGLNRPMYLIEW